MRPVLYLPRTRNRSGSALRSAARWLAACGAVLWLAWAAWNPASGGSLGRLAHGLLHGFLGHAAILVPLLLLYGLTVLYFRLPGPSGYLAPSLGGLLTLAGASAGLAALQELSGAAGGWGGRLGGSLAAWLRAVAGPGGVWLAAAALLLGGLHVLFGIPWARLWRKAVRLIQEDYRSWLRYRKDFQKMKEAPETAPEPFPEAPPVPRPAYGGTASLDSSHRLDCPSGPQDEEPAPGARRAPSETSPRTAVPRDVSGAERSEPEDVIGAENVRPAPRDGARRPKFPLPPLELLDPAKGEDGDRNRPSAAELAQASSHLEGTLASFQIDARVTGTLPGPVVTRYEVSPAPGVKVSSITALQNDIALALKAQGIRVIAPIPGKAAIGFEIPNPRPALVTLRQVLETAALRQNPSPLAFALGLTAEGDPAAADLASMPHLLIAGATNSGKSVTLHALILSILFRSGPEEVKLCLIDPKRLELTFYEGIPHLYDPKTPCGEVRVITQPKEAARTLQAMVRLMGVRYERFQQAGVRNIAAYNRAASQAGRPTEPLVVVVIDELADLMMVAREMVEESILRLAQMARAVGIHLVLCTQRPSVDVITGVIKANLTARIALQVITKTDSRVILDTPGAEALLGRGDMLYLATGAQRPMRIQGAYVSEGEIARVARHLKTQGRPEYETVLDGEGPAAGSGSGGRPPRDLDELREALHLIVDRRRVSQDLLKAHFRSSARATDLLSLLEVKGFIHKPVGTNRWEIHFDEIDAYLRT